MRTRHGWAFVSMLLFAALAAACAGSPGRAGAPAGGGEMDAGPQQHYAVLSMDAQNAAMRRIEEVRRRKREGGLRDRLRPADWIAMAYHGLVLDANFDVIELDDETVSAIQESMFSILQGAAGERVNRKHGGDLGALFRDPGLRGTERVVVRSAILEALLAESESSLRERYAWRHRLIHRPPDARTDDGRAPALRPSVRERMRQLRLPAAAPADSAAGYVSNCRSQEVPIPPDWPDARWISQGPLGLVFISKDLSAEVFAYKDPQVPGVCYALPRRDASGSIQILGIICQSDATGKACFWDNRTRDNQLLTGVNLKLEIDRIGNGMTLSERCTDCHRGDNVFNIHPGTALDLSRRTVVGGPYDTDPDVRYSPIAQAGWANPPSLVLPQPPAGQKSCVICHEIPQTGPFFCQILESAAIGTMPPTGPSRAGWPPTVDRRYADHIGRLAACP